MTPTAPEIRVLPEAPFVDDRLQIELRGLEPGARVSLVSEIVADDGARWRSQADFDAGSDGCVDIDAAAPVSGSWSTADAMGAIWAMRPEAGRDGSGFDTSQTTPLPLRLSIERAGVEIAGHEIDRRRIGDGVTREVVGDDGLVGTLFVPPGAGPHPALIHVSGSSGGKSENTAALYATRGYATLALAYFAAESLPVYLNDIPLEYFERAIDWLARRTDIDEARVAVQGASRGGELALLLATRFPRIAVAIGYVPSHVVWGGFGRETGEPPRPAWTWRGDAVPHVNPLAISPAVAAAWRAGGEQARRGEPVALTPSFVAYLENEAEVAKAAIPIERARAAVLLISGDDDQMWPSAHMAARAAERMRERAPGRVVEHLCYRDAGHLIASPWRPTTVSHSRHPVDGSDYAYGGSPEGGAAANEDSWRRVLGFLAAHL